ncbi:RNA-binding transcriptional accessory protein [Bacillus inaquosorum]|uniref:RNA-binding transcriptional accessory protein n=1 Tax=Bacillus inaquosorum TaxID=483913 RepID=A0A9Q4HTJ7_9BACI|nr:Tex family protein [Bacillus inaquosorum]MCY8084702.1 RNA-binding transcriptional accessory protein [Bacillus inaquosorum]MCY8161415.1 RNA-binding transcriptional accessory protein [Bacillus inaquosorum]MCY8171732.1 RNA-binding transcriptional accessory protein [Bacillus inaquosorum]MCY8322775.1 RNA-binding transcriptional accessory protein [Bacillus inaquosorum]MCY8336177.1 RNA-binding transcriptional accessory protein [Bacillus inaquosorum]
METSALLKQQIAKEIGLSQKHVESVIRLLEDGNTVPFIARYRKEQTGSMDEVQIQTISERWQYIQNLNQRKEEVIRLIAEQDKLTDDLKRKIEQSVKLQEVEDLYRPYKQKRKTKATVAKSKGLEPLADYILTLPQDDRLAEIADQYISEEKEVFTREEAIEGAKHIIAEQISDEPNFRKWIRQETFKKGTIKSTAGKSADTDEKNVYEMYYEYEEPIAKVVPHRVLAMNRGEKEDILKVSIEPPADHIKAYLEKQIIKNRSTSVKEILQETIEDSYKRLIQPAIEREIRKELSEKADEQAIHIFSENLRKLLLQPPMKGKTVLGVDPAFRTGCKLAVSDETGKVLKNDVIYPHAPVKKTKEAHEKVKAILEQYQVEMVAIGNGTASRETEQFIVNVLKDMPRKIYYVIVNEAGASVYSASELAREEFPELQVEERSAVSIARRLQDPLAELVKIDPKSVGVGQYQHDVSQKRLNESLRFVVETVVNQVGVNVNTASAALLQYVAGLSKSVAGNIVKKREEIGKFSNRKELKDIPRLGAKTYEQCIGFLRVQEGTEPLDRTGIHPESYKETKALLKKLGLSTEQIGTAELKDKINQLALSETAKELGIGEITLKDICEQLTRPERDPRDEVPKPLLKTDVLQLEDLKEGMELQGTVRNVVDFGAFVDIGVKQDGLVHISKLSNQFVKHPLDVVSVGDIVTVWVDGVDVQKGRVSLSMVK